MDAKSRKYVVVFEYDQDQEHEPLTSYGGPEQIVNLLTRLVPGQMVHVRLPDTDDERHWYEHHAER